MYQIIFSILFILLLIIVYIQRPYENILEPLRQAKVLLKDTNYSFPERFLSPSILPINIINYLPRGKYLGYPILLVPDIGGCKLYGKEKDKRIFQIWPNSKNLAPFINYAEKWKSRFETKIQKGIIVNKYNIEIKSGEGIDSVDILYKFGNGISFSFHPLIISLLRRKYISNQTLFAAPYEFRKISNSSVLLPYFSKIKYIIEYSFQKNKKPMILVGHTLGGILINIFLNFSVSKEWKQKYIKKFIAIHVPWQGCQIANSAISRGTDEGIGIRSLAHSTKGWYHSIEQNMGGIHLLLPETSNLFLEKLFTLRKLDPGVEIHHIQATGSNLIPLTEVQPPKSLVIKLTHKINSSHKRIINNINFLKLFMNIIKDAN